MGCGTTCAKYLVFFINFVFVLAGIALIVVGALIQAQVNEVSNFIESKFSAPPIALIVLGVIVFIIAFYGCCGAIRESSCMLTTFAIFLMIILVAEVVIAILAFVYRGETENALQTELERAYNNWTQEPDAVNGIQRALKCCGLDDSSSFPGSSFPPSCCGRGAAESSCTSNEIYRIGCRQALVDFINNAGLILGGVAIGIAVVLIFGITFGFCLASSFRRKGFTV